MSNEGLSLSIDTTTASPINVLMKVKNHPVFAERNFVTITVMRPVSEMWMLNVVSMCIHVGVECGVHCPWGC